MKTAYLTSILMIVILLASCSGGSASPTPTPVDVNALQTAAVQTVVADITQTASAAVHPTETAPSTETPVPTPTETPVPTETPTQTLTPTPVSCDNSEFINDASVPDGTVMTAGQEFIKTWKVKNTGTCSWTPGYRIVFSHGVEMGGMMTELTTEVAPGAETEIAVKMKAPLKNGNYSGYWRLANNNGYPFGERFSVVIIVP